MRFISITTVFFRRVLRLKLFLVSVLAVISVMPAAVASKPVLAAGDTTNLMLWDTVLSSLGYTSVPHDISPDMQGNLYAVVHSGPVGGALTAYLVKLDQNGSELWREQLGRSYERTFTISADKTGNVYAYGGALTRILTKYDPVGNPLWTHEVQTSSSSAYVTADPNGSVYVTAGINFGSVEAPDWDVSLIKYDGSGNKLWSQIIATDGAESALGVSAGVEEVYVIGSTSGAFPGYTRSGPIQDSFLAKYSANGTQQWLNQYSRVYFSDVAVDNAGNAYTTQSEYFRPGSSGEVSAMKFDRDGAIRLRIPLAMSRFDPKHHSGIAVDARRNIYVSGFVYPPSSPDFPDLVIQQYNAFGQVQFEKKIATGIGPGTIRVGKSGDFFAAYFADKSSGNPGFDAHLVRYQGDDDTDGDGLLDRWETYGVTIDGKFIDLPAMGARPDRKDIFVEVDWMKGCEPKPGSLETVVQAFLDATLIENVDKSRGISLHVDAGPASIMIPGTATTWGGKSGGKEILHTATLGSTSILGNYDWDDFDAIKKANFDSWRLPIFHYCLFVDKLGGLETNSGISRNPSGTDFQPSSDFVVSLGSWNKGTGGTALQQSGTFMHELGHNLGLRHGGVDDISFKPNYLSIMNYAFQTDGLRMRDPASGNFSSGYFDYSVFDDLADLDTTNLNEIDGLTSASANPLLSEYGTIFYNVFGIGPAGVIAVPTRGPRPIDWDLTAPPYLPSVSAPDIAAGPRGEGVRGALILRSGEDWHNLKYTGGSIGQLGAEYDELPLQTPIITEFAWEDEQAQGHEYYVTVTAPATSSVSPGGSTVDHHFTLTNTGNQTDTYSLSATSSRGWTNLAGLPATVTLAAGESTDVAFTVSLPTASFGEDELELRAVSQANPRIWDTGKAYTVLQAVSAASEQQVTSYALTDQRGIKLAIGADWLVWTDTPEVSGNTTVSARNLNTGEVRQVANYDRSTTEVDVDGDIVVYAKGRRLYVYDLGNDTELQIVPPFPDQSVLSPGIDGSRIVYSNYGDIYMYDLASGLNRTIAYSSQTKSNPSIHGDRIVWQTTIAGGNNDIYMFDLSTDIQSVISANTADQTEPQVYGDKIVWQDKRTGTWNLYMYDLATETETAITNYVSKYINGKIYPSFWGDRVVGLDYRNSVYPDVYMYDVRTGEETSIATETGNSEDYYRVRDSIEPTIHGTHIAYAKQHTVHVYNPKANWPWSWTTNVYMTTIVSGPETVLSTEPPAPGSDGWFNSIPAITLTPDSAGASTFYQWDSNSSLGWTAYAGNFTALQGEHTLNYYSVDATGNTEAVRTRQFSIDVTPPATSLAAAPAFDGVVASTFKVVPQLTLTTGELPSISHYAWDSPSGTWTTFTGPFSGQAGQHTLYYYSVDAHGNVEEVQNQVINVDTTPDGTPPVTSISTEPVFTSGQAFVTSPEVSLSVNEPAVTYVSWDIPMEGVPDGPAMPQNAGWNTFTAGPGPTIYLGRLLAPSGRHTLYYLSRDSAGNVEAQQSQEFAVGEIPNTAPSVNAGADASVAWGNVFARSASFADPDSDNWTATVDYGDGSAVHPLALDGKAYTLNHVYAGGQIGERTVTVTVDDGSGGTATDTLKVTVTRRTTSLVYSGNTSVQYSDPATVRATLTDSGGGALDGAALPGMTVRFGIGSLAPVAVTTNSTGIAEDSGVLSPGVSGLYSVTSVFEGDDLYSATQDTDTFEIFPEDATLEFTHNPGTLKATAGSAGAPAFVVKIKVTEIDDGSPGDLGKITSDNVVLNIKPAGTGTGGINGLKGTLNRDTGWIEVTFNVPAGLAANSYILEPALVNSWYVAPASPVQDLIVVSDPAPSTSPSGGGFIGGGGDGVAQPGYTSLAPYTNSDGLFNLEVTVCCASGDACVYVAKSVVASDKAGTPLKQLAIFHLSTATPEPPVGSIIIDALHDIMPDGAAFSPFVSLSIRFDPATLPANVKAGSLYIARRDGNTWQVLETTVNEASTTATAHSLGYGQYALMGTVSPPLPSPTTPPALAASFGLNDLLVSPRSVDPGQQVTVSVTVTNAGNISGEHKVVLNINGIEETSRTVTVAAGASATASFNISRNTPGSYAVDIGGLGDFFTVNRAATTPAPTQAPVSGGGSSPVGMIIVLTAVIAVSAFVIGFIMWKRRKRQA